MRNGVTATGSQPSGFGAESHAGQPVTGPGRASVLPCRANDPTTTAAGPGTRTAQGGKRIRPATPTRVDRGASHHPHRLRPRRAGAVRRHPERLRVVHERPAADRGDRGLRPGAGIDRALGRRHRARHVRHRGSARDPVRGDPAGDDRRAGGGRGPELLEQPVRRLPQHRPRLPPELPGRRDGVGRLDDLPAARAHAPLQRRSHGRSGPPGRAQDQGGGPGPASRRSLHRHRGQAADPRDVHEPVLLREQRVRDLGRRQRLLRQGHHLRRARGPADRQRGRHARRPRAGAVAARPLHRGGRGGARRPDRLRGPTDGPGDHRHARLRAPPDARVGVHHPGAARRGGRRGDHPGAAARQRVIARRTSCTPCDARRTSCSRARTCSTPAA